MSDDQSISLLDHASQQLMLSSDMPAAVFESVERDPDPANRQFTGARLFSQDQERYHMIVSLRAEGLSKSQVSQLLKVSRNTVTAVEDRESSSKTVEQIKRGLSKQCRRVSRLSLDALEEILTESPEKVDPKALAVILGVTVEKGELLDGRATHRVEELVSDPAADAYAKLREVFSLATGLGGGKPPTKGDLAVEDPETGPTPYKEDS